MGASLSKCCNWNDVTVPKALPSNEQPQTEMSVTAMYRPQPPVARTKKMSVQDFKNIAELGQGGYGKVHLVEKRATGERIAMKVIPKSLLQSGKDRRVTVEEILSEKDIMMKNDNPFLVKLIGCFQDEVNLYFLMELLHGGNLFSHLHQIPKHRLSEDVTRFYSAEVVMALEHLHDHMHIIYRDLKPENILLTQDGHIKLADFGLAKRAERMQGEVKGTPDFIAPEVYSNQEYTHMVDYWSLGCLIFEMLYGKPAFGNEGNEKRYTRILSGKFTFPAEVKTSEEAKSLIRRLLDVNPSTRLGANGVQEIKNHPFFTAIDWNKIFRKEISPPFGKLALKMNAPTAIVDVNGPKGVTVEGFTFIPDTPQIKLTG